MEISISPEEAVWIVIASTLLILFLASGFVLAYMYYKRNITIQLISAKEKEVEYKSNLLESQIEGEDRERERIASEIHDEVGSRLAILRLNLVHVLTLDDQELNKEALHVLKTFDQLVESAQRISHGLMPPELEHAGLVAAINGVVESFNHGDLEISFNAKEPEYEFRNPEVDISIYKIIFELIHNTLKHANATKITLSMEIADNQIHLKYSDNGVGFDLNKSYLNGLGLRSIESRCEFIGSKFQIHSKPNQGFQFDLSAKYESNESNQDRFS